MSALIISIPGRSLLTRAVRYFHNGILYRSGATEEVASHELFVDLLYVGIIALHGDQTAEAPTAYQFLKFGVCSPHHYASFYIPLRCLLQATFIPSWKIWTGISHLISQFETDDLTQRAIVLFVLACLVGFTIVSYSDLLALMMSQ